MREDDEISRFLKRANGKRPRDAKMREREYKLSTVFSKQMLKQSPYGRTVRLYYPRLRLCGIEELQVRVWYVLPIRVRYGQTISKLPGE